MASLQVPRGGSRGLLEALARRDFVGLGHTARRGRARATRRPSCCSRCPSGAAGRRCSPTRPLRPPRPSRACARSTSCSSRGWRRRVIFDLGLVRNIGYYTGAVFEVYDPALGGPIGGGGRYDDLLGRLRRARCPRSASPWASIACTSLSRARSAGPGAARAARRERRRARPTIGEAAGAATGDRRWPAIRVGVDGGEEPRA